MSLCIEPILAGCRYALSLSWLDVAMQGAYPGWMLLAWLGVAMQGAYPGWMLLCREPILAEDSSHVTMQGITTQSAKGAGGRLQLNTHAPKYACGFA